MRTWSFKGGRRRRCRHTRGRGVRSNYARPPFLFPRATRKEGRRRLTRLHVNCVFGEQESPPPGHPAKECRRGYGYVAGPVVTTLSETFFGRKKRWNQVFIRARLIHRAISIRIEYVLSCARDALDGGWIIEVQLEIS